MTPDEEMREIASSLRAASDRLGTLEHGSAALIKRSLDEALRYVPEPAPDPAQAPVAAGVPGADGLASIIRREVQAALRGLAQPET